MANTNVHIHIDKKPLKLLKIKKRASTLLITH